jgi:hypothetical protein
MEQLFSLLMPYSSPIFEVSATILATTIVLFFTLILIPLQQCASYYSPSLLKYFRRDRVAIECMLILFLSMFFNIYMLFIPTLKVHAVISFVLLVFSFVCIVLMILHLVKMLSPADYLLPKIKDDCIKILERGLAKTEDITPQQKIEQLKEQMEQVLIVAEKVDPKEEKWAVPSQISNEMFMKMLPLKSIAMKLIETSDYEVFARVIQTIRDISIIYFEQRQSYKSFHDTFLFSLSETLTDVIKMAENSSNVYFTRILFGIVRDIALSTLTVQVLGYKSGYNYLTKPLSSILKERAQVAIFKRDRDRAYDATINLGDIGKRLAFVGAGHSASEIASELGQIAKLCATVNDTVTLVPVRSSLAEIFFYLFWNRKLYPNYDMPYKKMLEVYKIMLHIPVDAGTALSIGDPLFAWNADLSQDRSLSTLVYAALFSPNNDDNVIEYNLEEVRNIVVFIEKHHGRNNINTTHFTQHLYQIGLWLLAFIDPEVTLEMILSQQAVTPTNKNKEKAKGILINMLDYFTNTYFECLEDKKKKNIKEGEFLFSFLSLLCLSIHLDNTHNLGLTKGLNLILEELNKKVNSLKCEIDWTARESIRMFCDYLDKIGKKEIAGKIWTITTDKSENYGSINRLSLFDHIKRPIVTFDSNLFTRFDKEIFSQDVKNK